MLCRYVEYTCSCVYMCVCVCVYIYIYVISTSSKIMYIYTNIYMIILRHKQFPRICRSYTGIYTHTYTSIIPILYTCLQVIFRYVCIHLHGTYIHTWTYINNKYEHICRSYSDLGNTRDTADHVQRNIHIHTRI